MTESKKVNLLAIIFLGSLFIAAIVFFETDNDLFLQLWGLTVMGFLSYLGLRYLQEFYKEFFNQGIKRGLWKSLKSPLTVLFALVYGIFLPVGFIYSCKRFFLELFKWAIG